MVKILEYVHMIEFKSLGLYGTACHGDTDMSGSARYKLTKPEAQS
jgi:hypothetical protein